MSEAVLRCRFCGASPAVDATIHEHHGMIVLMQHLRYRGPFCRSCGDRVLARATKRTLLMGWWGVISVVMTPITLILNMMVRGRLHKLPEATAQPAAAAPAHAAPPSAPAAEEMAS